MNQETQKLKVGNLEDEKITKNLKEDINLSDYFKNRIHNEENEIDKDEKNFEIYKKIKEKNDKIKNKLNI